MRGCDATLAGMVELVGRQGELEALSRACTQAAREARVTAVLIEGPSGIGKTRLLDEGLRLQPIENIVRVAGYEPEGDLPFAVGRELIAALMRSSLEAGAQLAPVMESTTREDPLAWMTVFEAAHRAVTAGPALVIALDDFQWADHQSRALLHYLIRGADAEDVSVAFLIAGRASFGVLGSSLQRLLEDRLTRMVLDPLDESSAVRLARSANPLLDEAEAKRVAVRAEGSPFWCRLLATTGDPERDVGRLVADALTVLADDPSRLFTTVVLLARPVHLDEISQIHGWSAARARAAMEHLEATLLVTGHGGVIQVAHDLVREVSQQRIPEAARRAVHASIAAWLEERTGDDVTLLLNAARHHKAAGLDPTATIRRILRSSTRRFIGRDGLETILELVDTLPPDHPQELALQHDVALLAGELGRHTVALSRWYAVGDRLEDPVQRARAWLAASDAAQHLELPEEARTCLARARRSEVNDPLLAIEIDAADAAITRWLEHKPDEAQRLTSTALQRSRALASSSMTEDAGIRFRSAYLRTLTLACVDAMQRNAPAEILPLTDEMDALANSMGAGASAEAGLRTGSALMLLGQLREAEGRLEAAWAIARRASLPDLALDIGSWLVWTRYLRGDLQGADETALECSALAARIGEASRPAKIAHVWHTIMQISYGDRDVALNQLPSLAREESDPHHRIILHESIAKWSARLYEAAAEDDVREALDAGRTDAEAARCQRCSAQFELSAVETLVRIGAREEAVRRLQSAESAESAESGTLLEQWNLVRARASLMDGVSGLDPLQLRDAVEMADRVGLGLEAIWARLDLGRAIAKANREAAVTVFQEARKLAEDTHAILEKQLAERHLRGLGVRTWGRGRASGGSEGLGSLTERERQICRLIADGSTNPQIAQALFLSRKTVERHVSNIFSKLGVKNRAELASRVATADGTGPDTGTEVSGKGPAGGSQPDR